MGPNKICDVQYTEGIHNIWPAGKMWPAEAFNLTRNPPIFAYLAYFFNKYTLWMCLNISTLALRFVKKKFGPSMRYELCTPDYTISTVHAGVSADPKTHKFKKDYVHKYIILLKKVQNLARRSSMIMYYFIKTNWILNFDLICTLQ